MEFDNTPTTAPPVMTTVKDHIPIVLLGGCFVAVFIGLHTAATAVVAVAAVHLLAVAAFMGIRWFRNSRKAVQS